MRFEAANAGGCQSAGHGGCAVCVEGRDVIPQRLIEIGRVAAAEGS
jgi:hypothetical protein